jgi:bifunctional DNase/RNase
MRTVRLAHAEPRPDKTHIHHVLVVLADDANGRVLPIWLLGLDGHSLRLLHQRQPDTGTAGVPEELTDRLLRAAGITVTSVDIDELGPEVPVARIGLHTPTGGRQVLGRLADGLALAVAYGAPIRVDEALLDQLAEPAPQGDLLAPFLNRRPQAATRTAQRGHRPRNMAFTHGLDGWDLRGSFMRSPTAAHWQDYYCQATGQRTAILEAAVPEPYGFADLRQAVRADRYRSRTVRFRGQLRGEDIGDQAGLYLRIVTEDTARDRIDQRTVATISDTGWTQREVSMQVPEDAAYLLFGITITGQGRIELRNAELAPA